MAETTREAIRRLVLAEPTWNRTRIADELGVSRERVRQIVTQEGLAVAKGVVGIRPRGARPSVARVLTGGVPVPLTAVTAGTIGELLVACDLLARGYVVFAPLAMRSRGPSDLIMTLGTTLERVEVRCGTRNARGVVKYNRPVRGRADRIAVVLTGEPVIYDPPFAGEQYPRTPFRRPRATEA